VGRKVDSSRRTPTGRGVARSRTRSRSHAARHWAMRKASAQKKPGRLTPEQQRQEENGDAAASPATYRKDRQRIFARVRNFFRPRARFPAMHLLRLDHGPAHVDARRAGPACGPISPALSRAVLIASCAEPWRADRFPRDGLLHGRLRCCCRRSAGSGPCLLPTGVAARRRVAPDSPSRFARG